MAKAIGIGGVFFRARDSAAHAAWYETHLGIPGLWQQQAGMTVFAPFPAGTLSSPRSTSWGSFVPRPFAERAAAAG